MLIFFICIFVLLIFSAVFSMSETAFACVNKIRLKHMAEKGDQRAASALHCANRYEQALTAILVGNNIANICSSSLATVVCTQLFGSAGALVSTIVMTAVVLTFCEVLPKSYAKSHADKIALTMGKILNGFTVAMTPFVKFFDMLSGIFRSKEDTPSVTEDELKVIIDEIEEEGVLEEQESDLVLSALQFDETKVTDILIPRVKISAISINTSLETLKSVFLNGRFSRYPVYENTMDNIIGMVTNHGFLQLLCGEKNGFREIIQDILYIPETQTVNDVLHEMQRTKTHMAIIVDQYGGTEGLVTLEDILEELVGEIYDETDEVIRSFHKVADHVYEISGSLNVREAIRLLDDEDKPHQLPEHDSSTLSGWITELSGHLPYPGEKAEYENFHFTVLEAEDMTVKTLRLEVNQTTK